MLSHLLRLVFPNCSLQHIFSSTLSAILFCQGDVVHIETLSGPFADYVILGAIPISLLFTYALGLSCQRFHSYILNANLQSLHRSTCSHNAHTRHRYSLADSLPPKVKHSFQAVLSPILLLSFFLSILTVLT